MNNRIKTYRTTEFREKYLAKHPAVEGLFKPHFERFFCVRIEEVQAYTKFPVAPVREDGHTLIFITGGRYAHRIGYREIVAGQDELLCTPAGQVFSSRGLSEEVRGFTCHFHPDVLIGTFGSKEVVSYFGFLRVWGNPHIKLSKQRSQFVLQLFERIYCEYATNGIGNLELIQAYLLALLTEINYSYLANDPRGLTAAAALANRFQEALFATRGRRTVSAYAGLLNVSANHLTKSVKQATGKSPTRWIAETKVTEAKYLLYQTEWSIGEIAVEVGYIDPSYFARFFKKMEGVTPREFRARIETS